MVVYQSDEDEMVLETLVTDPGARKLADQLGQRLLLEPVQLKAAPV